MQFELVGVPYTSMAAPGGIAGAIGVLRSAGLVERLRAAGDVDDRGDLDLIEGSGQRGPSGLLNEAALARLIVATREAVTGAHDRHRIPLLIGGDCPVLLGALAALRDRHGSAALLLVDGHEDAWPPRLSPTGEASDSEVGLALGHFDATLPDPVDRLLPLLEADGTAILGPRAATRVTGANEEQATHRLLEGVKDLPKTLRYRDPTNARSVSRRDARNSRTDTVKLTKTKLFSWLRVRDCIDGEHAATRRETRRHPSWGALRGVRDRFHRPGRLNTP